MEGFSKIDESNGESLITVSNLKALASYESPNSTASVPLKELCGSTQSCVSPSLSEETPSLSPFSPISQYVKFGARNLPLSC